MTTDALEHLSDAGVAIWLDDLSRQRIASGDLAALVERRHVTGVTTNPSIFQQAISQGSGYDTQLDDLAARGVGVDEAIRMITTVDVRAAADLLRPVFDATHGRDGRVSIEVDPRLAHDPRATVAEAKQLPWLVDRPNTLLDVTDTGSGIAPGELPYVFDRFWRSEKSRSRRTGGSGLGLPIVRHLMAAHGGTAEARSEPGTGTVFTLRLPSGGEPPDG